MCVSVFVPGGKSLENKAEVGRKTESESKRRRLAEISLTCCSSFKTSWKRSSEQAASISSDFLSGFPSPLFPKQPEEKLPWFDPSDVRLHPLPPPRPPPGCPGPPDPVNLAGVTGQRSKDAEGRQAGLHQGELLVGWVRDDTCRNDPQVICWNDGNTLHFNIHLKIYENISPKKTKLNLLLLLTDKKKTI